MIKEFLTKQATKFATRGLPKEQQEAAIKMVEENPELMEMLAKNKDLFEKIQSEIKSLTDSGKPEEYAAMDVMKKYQPQLIKAVQESGIKPEDLQKIASIMGGR